MGSTDHDDMDFDSGDDVITGKSDFKRLTIGNGVATSLKAGGDATTPTVCSKASDCECKFEFFFNRLCSFVTSTRYIGFSWDATRSQSFIDLMQF